MQEAAFASPIGMVKLPPSLVRIKCGCGANGDVEQVRLRHGVDVNGSVKPCPNPQKPEHLGRADEMSALVEKYGFTSWDEFAEHHPIVAKFYMKKNRAKQLLQDRKN
jgi:hypothetical protein